MSPGKYVTKPKAECLICLDYALELSAALFAVAGCSSVTFSTATSGYFEVCGKVIAYQHLTVSVIQMVLVSCMETQDTISGNPRRKPKTPFRVSRGGSRLFVKGGFEFVCMSILHFFCKNIYIFKSQSAIAIKIPELRGASDPQPPLGEPSGAPIYQETVPITVLTVRVRVLHKCTLVVNSALPGHW